MEGKTKRYKNGNYDMYRWFTDATWKNMCDRDRAMWTEFNENEPAPIPKEVLEFKEKNELDVTADCKCSKCDKLEARVRELEDEILALKGTPAPDFDDLEKVQEALSESDIEARREDIKEQLTELGIKFRANTGLPKLTEKLKEAKNANPQKQEVSG